MVYAVCTGAYDYSNPANDTPAKIAVIDPSADAVIDSIYIGGHATDIAIGADGIGYVATTTAVLQIDTRAPLPITPSSGWGRECLLVQEPSWSKFI